MKDDKTEGEWISFYESGPKQSECLMKDSKKDGKIIGFYENGKMQCYDLLADPNEKSNIISKNYENFKSKITKTIEDPETNVVNNEKNLHFSAKGKSKSE